MKIEDFPNDEEMMRCAAKTCFYPTKSQGEYAMRLVIERLVLPDDVGSYDEKTMYEYIKAALLTEVLDEATKEISC